MLSYEILLALLVVAALSYVIGKFLGGKKKTSKSGDIFSNGFSLPSYYGYCSIIWVLVPTILIGIVFANSFPDIVNNESYEKTNRTIKVLIVAILSIVISLFFIVKTFNAREHVEGWVKVFLILCSFISISITVLIFASVLFESVRFFKIINVLDFLFGLEWSPQTAIRSDQAGSSGKFGIIPVFAGTILITLVAMVVAVPLGILSAIYIGEYSSKRFRDIIKPVLEILAGIPTVVYGYFAAVTLGPLVKEIFLSLGLSVASESAFAAGFVMGIMIIPYMMSLTDDVMNAVPRALRDASLGLGATKSETIRKVVIPAALPGIMGAFLLAVSRAIGETMIVVMAAGLIAKLTLNPFESVTTVTAQIVKLLVGDQEFDSAKTLAAFALSLTLFMVTLLINIAALIIVKKYRERYE